MVENRTLVCDFVLRLFAGAVLGLLSAKRGNALTSGGPSLKKRADVDIECFLASKASSLDFALPTFVHTQDFDVSDLSCLLVDTVTYRPFGRFAVALGRSTGEKSSGVCVKSFVAERAGTLNSSSIVLINVIEDQRLV